MALAAIGASGCIRAPIIQAPRPPNPLPSEPTAAPPGVAAPRAVIWQSQRFGGEIVVVSVGQSTGGQAVADTTLTKGSIHLDTLDRANVVMFRVLPDSGALRTLGAPRSLGPLVDSVLTIHLGSVADSVVRSAAPCTEQAGLLIPALLRALIPPKVGTIPAVTVQTRLTYRTCARGVAIQSAAEVRWQPGAAGDTRTVQIMVRSSADSSKALPMQLRVVAEGEGKLTSDASTNLVTSAEFLLRATVSTTSQLRSQTVEQQIRAVFARNP